MTAPAPNARLSSAPPPKASLRKAEPATTQIAESHKFDGVAVGDIPNRPIGSPEHPAGYDPRDARAALTPKGQADKLLVEGAAWLGEGRFERARKSFKDAVEHDPQRAEAYNGVGVTYYARGDYDEALAWYKRSLEADPRFGDAFYNMACVYALQKHPELAFRYLRMAALNHYAAREAMEKDEDLAGLRSRPEWQQILDQMGAAEAKPSP
jgi:tetratricopeptide (TPR) repeat protein